MRTLLLASTFLHRPAALSLGSWGTSEVSQYSSYPSTVPADGVLFAYPELTASSDTPTRTAWRRHRRLDFLESA